MSGRGQKILELSKKLRETVPPPLDNTNAAGDQVSARDGMAKADVEEAISKVWNQERVQTMAPDLDTLTLVTMSPTQTPLTVLSQEGAIRTQSETESDNLVTTRPIDSLTPVKMSAGRPSTTTEDCPLSPIKMPPVTDAVMKSDEVRDKTSGSEC